MAGEAVLSVLCVGVSAVNSRAPPERVCVFNTPQLAPGCGDGGCPGSPWLRQAIPTFPLRLSSPRPGYSMCPQCMLSPRKQHAHERPASHEANMQLCTHCKLMPE